MFRKTPRNNWPAPARRVDSLDIHQDATKDTLRSRGTLVTPVSIITTGLCHFLLTAASC